MEKGRRDQKVCPTRRPRSGRLMVTPTAVYYIYCCYGIFLNEPHDFTHLGDSVTLIVIHYPPMDHVSVWFGGRDSVPLLDPEHSISFLVPPSDAETCPVSHHRRAVPHVLIFAKARSPFETSHD